jgi:hypothetical protein
MVYDCHTGGVALVVHHRPTEERATTTAALACSPPPLTSHLTPAPLLRLPDYLNSQQQHTQTTTTTMVLTQEEIDGCREAFLAFDKDRSGTIDVWELRQVLEAMGQKPTEEELFQMISEVDDNMSGSIDFG